MDENNEVINNQEIAGTDTANDNQAESTEEIVDDNTKTFTQEQVNNIIKERLERANKSLYAKYGVNDAEGLEALIGQSQSYEVMKERYEQRQAEIDDLKRQLGELTESNAFMSNNINPNRYDDIRAYYKGKGLNFSNDSLAQEIATHPEWVQVSNLPKETTTIKTLGVDATPTPHETEEEKMKRIFRIK